MAHITSIPAREFARDLAGAKRAASDGPVLITDRGKPAYALLRIEEYYRLTGAQAAPRSLLQVMAGLPSSAGIDFEPECLSGAVQVPELD